MVARVTAAVYEPDNATFVVAVDDLVDCRWEQPLDGDGFGEITVGAENAAVGELSDRRIVRMAVDGVVRFAFIIERSELTAVSGNRVDERVLTVSGRSILAMWEDGRVQQWPGVGALDYSTREFSYHSPGLDRSGWVDAVRNGGVLDADAIGDPSLEQFDFPEGWLDPFADRIWCRAWDVSDSAPAGVIPFVATFTPASDQILRLEMAGDNWGVMHLNSVPVLRTNDPVNANWLKTFAAGVRVNAGVQYTLCGTVENIAGPDPNPAWLGVTAFLLDSPGERPSTENFVLHSDEDWETLDYPARLPGWRPPDVLDVLLGEFQDDQNAVTGWTIVDDTPDDWDEMPGISFEVDQTSGLEVLTKLRELYAEVYVADFESLELHVGVPGSVGNFADGPADPPILDVITRLEFRRESDGFDTVVVRWREGRVLVGTNAAANSRRAFLSAGNVSTAADAAEYGQIWLDAHSDPVDAVDLEFTPRDAAGDLYAPGLGLGDAVRVPDRTGVLVVGRLVSVGVAGLERNGDPRWAASINVRRQEHQVRVARTLQVMAAGTMGGSFAAAAPAPVTDPQSGIPNGEVRMLEGPVADWPELLTADPPFNVTAPWSIKDGSGALVRITFQAEEFDTGGGVSRFKILRNGVPISDGVTDLVIEWPDTGPGRFRYTAFFGGDLFSMRDVYQLLVIEAGGHYRGSAQPYFRAAYL